MGSGKCAEDGITAPEQHSLHLEGGAWGTRQAPLVPRAYRDVYGEEPAVALHAKLGELDRDWWRLRSEEELVEPVFAQLRRQIAGLAVPPHPYTFRAGVQVAWLLALPFRTRTKNAVRAYCQAHSVNGVLPTAWPAESLLAMRGSGRLTLVDFLCVAESAESPREAPSVPRQSSTPCGVVRTCQEQPGGDLGPWHDLLAVAQDFRGVATLQEALSLDLGQLAAFTGLDERLARIDLERLTGGRSLSGEFLAEVMALESRLSAREQLILRRRLFRRKPLKLREIGGLLGVTRERVRQIEKKLLSKIGTALGENLKILAGAVRASLEPVVSEEALQRELAAALPASSRDDGLALRILSDAVGYSCKKGLCYSPRAGQVASVLTKGARDKADDAGLVDELVLQDLLPSRAWLSSWPLLVQLSGLSRVGSHLALKNTKLARVKAAIIDIGRPATVDEIVARSGLEGLRIANYFSRLPSVVRADRWRWGLASWIEDEYDGIGGEILQRIDDDGGATRVDKLIEELPRRFGVQERSVRAYLGTAQFRVDGNYVSKADASTLRFRRLDDVVDGRDAKGRPFWRFRVEARFFDGYSLTHVPVEVARELGCEPGSRCEVSVARPSGCRSLSVRWPLASLSGCTIGFLREALRRLGAEEGAFVTVILAGPGEVELELGGPVEVESAAGGSGRAALERLQRRRRVL